MLTRLKDYKYFYEYWLEKWILPYQVSPETRHRSAFTTIFGKYEFLRMPFDLAQPPVYFIALMQKHLDPTSDIWFFHMENVLVHNSVI